MDSVKDGVDIAMDDVDSAKDGVDIAMDDVDTAKDGVDVAMDDVDSVRGRRRLCQGKKWTRSRTASTLSEVDVDSDRDAVAGNTDMAEDIAMADTVKADEAGISINQGVTVAAEHKVIKRLEPLILMMASKTKICESNSLLYFSKKRKRPVRTHF